MATRTKFKTDNEGAATVLPSRRQETTNRRIVRQTTAADAMSTTEQALIEKMRQLPPQSMAEVEDFVDFLRAREDDVHLARVAATASEAAFVAMWSNDDDAAYDRM